MRTEIKCVTDIINLRRHARRMGEADARLHVAHYKHYKSNTQQHTYNAARHDFRVRYLDDLRCDVEKLQLKNLYDAAYVYLMQQTDKQVYAAFCEQCDLPLNHADDMRGYLIYDWQLVKQLQRAQDFAIDAAHAAWEGDRPVAALTRWKENTVDLSHRDDYAKATYLRAFKETYDWRMRTLKRRLDDQRALAK